MLWHGCKIWKARKYFWSRGKRKKKVHNAKKKKPKKKKAG